MKFNEDLIEIAKKHNCKVIDISTNVDYNGTVVEITLTNEYFVEITYRIEHVLDDLELYTKFENSLPQIKEENNE